MINPTVWSLLERLCGLDPFDCNQETARIDEVHHQWPTSAQKEAWATVYDEWTPGVIHVGTYLEQLGSSDGWAGAPVHMDGMAWGITVIAAVAAPNEPTQFLSMEIQQAIELREALDKAIAAANKAYEALEQ